MPIYAVQCELCGANDEILAGINERKTICKKCGAGWTRRIPAVPGANCHNDDAAWIRTVLEVVDKEDRSPHTVEFRNNPTRANYKAWMKGEGLRPVDHGERINKPELDVQRHSELLMRRHQERKRIYVGGR
jgi:putative FmdB family regulatory protein